MITLLLALFIVLWAISSVNISQYTELKGSLAQAFSGKVLAGSPGIIEGGSAPLQPQGTQVENVQANSSSLPTPSSISESLRSEIAASSAQAEADDLRRVQHAVEAAARALGLARSLRTSIDERGLVIRLLTDKVLFDSGQADLKSRSLPLVHGIARILATDGLPNPVRVEGNTDNVPISSAVFHSNWELSAARATAVLTDLIAGGVPERRLSVTGYADQHPVASNATPSGRALNRRVEIVVLRVHPQPR
jgi:chemotaxis protein MotB